MRKKPAQSILIMISVIAILIIITEIILRIMFPQLTKTEYQIWPKYLQLKYEPITSELPGIIGEVNFKTNSEGIRAGEMRFSDKYRILTIGGSATECFYLDQTEHWPYLIQKNLNTSGKHSRYWVGNIGKSGHTAWQNLLSLKFLPLDRWKINAIIIMPSSVVDFKSYLSLYNQHPDPSKITLSINWDLLNKNPLSNEKHWYENSAVLSAIAHLRVKFYNQSHITELENIGYSNIMEHKERAAAKKLVDELPPMEPALKLYKETINALIDVAEQRKIRLILLTHPYMWRDDLPVEAQKYLGNGRPGEFSQKVDFYYSINALKRGIDLYNAALLEICDTRKLECLDLASMLDKNITDFYDDVHLNENGAVKTASILADYILKKGE